MADEQKVSRVLVIAAHPDDADFGSAGTIAQWTDAGIEVSYCIVTNGDAGGSDLSVSRSGHGRDQAGRADRRCQAGGRP